MLALSPSNKHKDTKQGRKNISNILKVYAKSLNTTSITVIIFLDIYKLLKLQLNMNNLVFQNLNNFKNCNILPVKPQNLNVLLCQYLGISIDGMVQYNLLDLNQVSGLTKRLKIVQYLFYQSLIQQSTQINKLINFPNLAYPVVLFLIRWFNEVQPENIFFLLS